MHLPDSARYTTLGVIGHVDHGKTALVKALTGTDTDRLREEKERGISIALGYAHLELPSGEIGIIDAPGHERFIRTMIAGATGMAAVLLVVDVNEGVKPQTVEHLDIARLLGIRLGVIAITKCDTADPDLRELVADDIRTLAAGTFLADAPLIYTSAHTAEGLDPLRDALDRILQQSDPAIDEGWAYLPVDRAFTMTGFGTVVTGTLHRGAIALEDELEIYPTGLRARVRELQSHNASTERALPGFRTAVNLRGVEKDRVSRGNVVAAPGSLQIATSVDVELRLLQSAQAPLKSRQAIRLLFGTTETFARTHLLDRDELAPGDTCVMQLRLDAPTPILNYEPFIVRSYSPMTTIGGGQFLATAQRGYRRTDAEALRRMHALATGALDERIAETLLAAGDAGLTRDALAQRTRASLAQIEKRLKKAPAETLADRVLHRDVAKSLRERTRQTLETFHAANPTLKGIAREQLNSDPQLRLDSALFNALVDTLLAKRTLAEDRGLLRLANFTPAGALSDAQRAQAQSIEAAFETAGLTPPRIDDVLGPDKERHRLYRFLLNEGRLVAAEVTTRNRVENPAIAFHRRSIDHAAVTLAERFGESPFTAAQAKEPLAITRKYLIPLLEAMDKLGLTAREADHRRLTIADPADQIPVAKQK